MESRSISFSDIQMAAHYSVDLRGNRVYKAFHRRTGVDYLVKEFCGGGYDSHKLAEIRRELEIVKLLDHPNILKCYEVFETESGKICLLLEHVGTGQTLSGVVISSEQVIARIARQVLLGVRYLHVKEISLGDIEPSNNFVDLNKPVFKVLYPGKILSGDAVVGPQETGVIHDKFSWDVWSVGSCILKLLRRSKAEKPSMEMLEFLSCCMQTETLASQRWMVDDLLQHSFLKQPDRLLSRLEDLRGHSFFKHPHFLLPKPIALHTSASTLYEEEGIMVVESSEDHMKIVQHASASTLSEEGGIMEVESSGDNMKIVPQVLERCYRHCVMLLSDCEFDKDKLVRMWIAEECIELEKTKVMEDVAAFYFDELVHQELIVPSNFDHLYEKMKYKVNPSKSPTWFSDQDSYSRIGESSVDKIPTEALHLVWDCRKCDETIVSALKNWGHLRTLRVLVDWNVWIDPLLNGIFMGLKLLRTLDLSRTHILELPVSIRLVEGLRYLDISETPIKQLPYSIGCLYYLETLNLRSCFELSALPVGFGRLINLRHLDLHIVGQLDFMPAGMGNLVKLQTLQAFIVGKTDGCGIGELRNMNDITGSFCILKLENVSSPKEAREAALRDKKRIDKLELRWQVCNSQETTEILECLQPHFSLKELQITNFSGLLLPTWISNPFYIDLATTTASTVIHCRPLENYLLLRFFSYLSSLDLGVQLLDASLELDNAFPKLEKLTLEKMPVLETWTGIEDGDFPCLSHIHIRHCPKLYVLPSLSSLCSLQHLEINDCMKMVSLPEGLFPASLELLIITECPNIKERCRKDGGQDSFKIADIKNVWIDFENISLG